MAEVVKTVKETSFYTKQNNKAFSVYNYVNKASIQKLKMFLALDLKPSSTASFYTYDGSGSGDVITHTYSLGGQSQGTGVGAGLIGAGERELLHTIHTQRSIRHDSTTTTTDTATSPIKHKQSNTNTSTTSNTSYIEYIQGQIRKHLSSTYITQNDGDEIVNAKVIAHIKYCEICSEVQSIHTPCFAYKSNYHWLQRNRHMQCFEGADEEDRQAQVYLKKYLWKPGPYLWPLNIVLDHQYTMRYNYTSHFCEHHMGLGAATHLSSTSDPVEYWLKACGTVENKYNCYSSVSHELVQAGRQGMITPELIFKHTIFPWYVAYMYIYYFIHIF